MKRILSLLLLLATSALASAAEPLPQYINTVHNTGVLTLNPGWTYLQDFGFVCSSGSTSCTYPTVLPTTLGSVWIIEVQTVNSVTLATTGGWTLCPSSECHAHDGNWGIDSAYKIGGSSGTTSISATVSGSPGGTSWYLTFAELMPPVGYTPSFDTGGANANSSANCTTCSGVALTTTGTDAIIQLSNIDNDFPLTEWNLWSGNYFTDINGSGLYLNAPAGSIAAPTFSQTPTGHAAVSALAFKSTAGSFATAAPFYNMVAISPVPYTSDVTCNSTCTLTLNATTGAGHLLFFQVANEQSAAYVSSISGGGTWVIPTGCQITGTAGAVGSLSCAYVLSSTSGTTSLSVTMNKNATVGMVMYEVSRASGSFVLDTLGSTTQPAGLTFSGQTLSISGNLDVLFQGNYLQGAALNCTLYPYYMYGSNLGYGNEFLYTNSDSMALLNTYTDVTQLCNNPQDTAVLVHGVAFK